MLSLPFKAAYYLPVRDLQTLISFSMSKFCLFTSSENFVARLFIAFVRQGFVGT